MKESVIQQEVRLALSKLGYVTFRNNMGSYEDAKGHWIKYGVCNPGGSDLIGWKQTIITPEMVGKRVAIFTAVEVKRPGGKVTEAQQQFIDVVNYVGGIAAVVRSKEEAEKVLNILG